MHNSSNTEKSRNQIKDKILDIYEESYHNYGAYKITKKLEEQGEHICEKTMGNYISRIGIKAQ